MDFVGAELYGELEDEEEEDGLQRPVEGDEALLKAIEPSFAYGMNQNGNRQKGHPQGALHHECRYAIHIELRYHPSEKQQCRGQICRAEENPRDEQERLAEQPAGHLHPPTAGGQTVEEETVAPLVHHKANAMHGTPENEHQRASVPKACHNHGEEVVEVGAHLPHPAASQGNVEIVAEPGGERNMPTSPKF